MAFVDEVSVAEVRSCMSDAGPCGAAMQLCLRDGPERVAGTDGVLRGSTRRSDGSGNDNLRTDFEKVGIAKTGIESEEFLPAAAITESRNSKLPKRVTGLDGDDGQFSGDTWRR